MKIKEFKAGDTINQPLLVASSNGGTTNKGDAYLSLELQDDTGTIDAKLWKVSDEQKKICQAGKVIGVNGEVILYSGRVQLKIFSVEETQGYKASDFREASPVNKDDLRQGISKAIDSIEDDTLSLIVKSIYEDMSDEFFDHPAASKNHHEYVGGLATHTLNMYNLADNACKQYPLLNRDLLVAGVLLHDTGKMEELSGGVVNDYTFEGKMLGHISIGAMKLYDKAKELNIENEEKIVLLIHLILSHHGKYEFGSPVLPQIPEAFALNIIDDFDAKMEMMRKEMNKLKEGDFSPRNFALDNRQLYKMHKEEE